MPGAISGRSQGRAQASFHPRGWLSAFCLIHREEDSVQCETVLGIILPTVQDLESRPPAFPDGRSGSP